ncbi:MAG: glycerol kinase GlpK [Saccharofermentans sp.]|nr:glycerol kinase GlpK [Saccharofermentans sp.]
MEYILCIDQGTTSTKAFLLDKDGQLQSGSPVPIKQYYPQPGYVEHDAEEILSSVLRASLNVLTKYPEAKGNIKAIGITNQRETTIAMDLEGRALYHAIVWQCRRTTDICRRPEIKDSDRRITEITGLKVDPYFSATKMLWLKENVEGLEELLRSGKALFATVDGFLVYNLTGAKSFGSDYSNCSRTMLFDITDLDYSDELLELFGIDKSSLAKPMPSCSDYGSVELGASRLTELGFDSEEISVLSALNGVKITGVLGDQPAALLGQNAVNEGDAKTTYGTGCFTLMNVGTNPVKSRSGLLTSCSWSYNGVTSYALEGSIFQAGSVISWLKDEMRLIDSPLECDSICFSIEDTGGVYLVPAFTGLGAPYWKPDCRGVLVGLTRGSGRKQIVRAGVESIAYQVTELVKLMMDDTGIKANCMRVDGGVCASQFLMQLQSDLLGIKIIRASSDEMTAMGAGLCAGLTCGFFKGMEEISSFYKASHEYTPDMSEYEVSERMDAYKDAVRAAMMIGNT